MSIKFLILLTIPIQYFYFIFTNDKIVPKLFHNTLINYFMMLCLSSFTVLVLLKNISIIGYLIGILITIVLTYTLIAIAFNKAYNIHNIQHISTVDTDINTGLKHKIYYYVMEASFIATIFYILMLSILVGISKYIQQDLETIFIVLISAKIIGHIYTKIGDIINDYKQKVLKKVDEDSHDDVYGAIDNIGDLFGDAFGNIIELIILIILFYQSFIITDINNHILIHNSFNKSSIFIFIIYALSKIYKKAKSFLNIILLVLIMLFTTFDPIIKYFIYYQYSFISTIKYIITSLILSLFTATPIVIILLLLEIAIHTITKYIYKAAKTIPVICIILNFVFSLLITVITMYIAVITIYIGNKYNIINYTKLFETIVICSILMVYKSYLGAFVDSACGIIKKYTYNNTKQTNPTTKDDHQLLQQQTNTIKQQYLEELDIYGNIYKLEAKVLINYFAQILVLIYSTYKYKYIFIADINIIAIITSILLSFAAILYHSYGYVTPQQHKQNIYMIPIYCFYIIMTSYICASTIQKIHPYYLFSVMMALLLISLFANISGTLFDSVKKIAEADKTQEQHYYMDLVKQDMLGDILKDVLGPILYCVFAIYFLNSIHV